MARIHSKDTVILVGGYDVSQYCNDSNCKRSSGTEDNTQYGKNSIVKDPTLLDGQFGCQGKYNDDAEGPRGVLYPMVGTKQEIIYRPEGTGPGLPQDKFDAVITGFETTAPTAGYRLWVLETEPSDDWDSTPQPL